MNFEGTSIHFPAWNMDWKDRKKKPFLRIESGGEVSILENGPLLDAHSG